MSKRIIDLSVAIEDGLPSDPPVMIPRIQYMDHQTTGFKVSCFSVKIKAASGGWVWAVAILD